MEKLSFTNRSGQNLSAILHTSATGTCKAYAVFAHCFTCTKNIRAAVHIADAMAEQGIAVMRFDFTGLGQSEGDFADTHFSSNVEDLIDAADYLATHYAAPQLLVGHSLGGTAVLSAAHDIDSVKAVATIGSPADAEHVLHLLSDNLDTIQREGEMTVQLAGRPFTIKQSFIDNLRQQSVRERLSTLRKPLMVMHSPIDETVSIDQASAIFTAAKHPRSFVSLDNADHLLSRESDSRYAAQVLATWATRYIDSTEQPHTFPATQANRVVVQSNNADGFLSTVNANGHTLLADEPISYGGTDLGATPYDLLGAALGACTAMTLNMYARRKDLPITQVTVSTQHNKIHFAECESCETTKGKVDQFERRIRIEGNITEEQRARMLEIADLCPVHKSLHTEVEVISSLE